MYARSDPASYRGKEERTDYSVLINMKGQHLNLNKHFN